MNKNEYIPFLSEIKEVIKHTDIEYTFRMEYNGEQKVWIVNTFSDNFFKGMFFKFFWC